MLRPAFAAVVALAVAGCGGAAKGPADASTAPPVSATVPVAAHITTSAEFVARADAICADLHRKLKPLQRHLDKLDTLSEMVPDAKKIVPLAHELGQRLGDVPLPAENRSALKEYVGLVQKQAREIRELSRALARGDVATAMRLTGQNSDYIARQLGMAKGLGLKVCGQS